MIWEYEVNNISKLVRFLDNEIGTEYEAISTENHRVIIGGFVVVYDLTQSEHKKIRAFIDKNNLYK